MKSCSACTSCSVWSFIIFFLYTRSAIFSIVFLFLSHSHRSSFISFSGSLIDFISLSSSEVPFIKFIFSVLSLSACFTLVQSFFYLSFREVSLIKYMLPFSLTLTSFFNTLSYSYVVSFTSLSLPVLSIAPLLSFCPIIPVLPSSLGWYIICSYSCQLP